MSSVPAESLQKKLLSVAFVTTFVALVVALGAVVAYDLRTYHLDLLSDMTTQAELLGHITAPALTFDDNKLATENLHQLRIRPRVHAAAIYTARGEIFATYAANADQATSIPKHPEAEGVRSERNNLILFKPIVSDGELLGTIYLRADYGLSSRVVDYLGIAAAAAAAAMAVAFFMWLKLQRAIIVPMLAIAEIARDVVQRRDYSRRAVKISDDEVGVLAVSFNDMLAEIERRTGELERSYQEVARESAERSRAQQEVMRLNTELEQRVRERTAELEVTNERLEREIVERRKAEAEAGRASRLKSEFLANMSHELRTPLNAIIGFTELIDDKLVTPEMPQYKEFLGDILASGRHLLQLINDVLDLSKVEAGKLEFHAEVVDLEVLIGEVLGVLRPAASAKSIRVESSVHPSLSEVVLDPARFKQVLYNYISNALKFTPVGGSVVVRAQPDEASAGFRLEVEDSGTGIAPEDLGRLFVEFQQLDAGAAKRDAGTGLGLALTRRLVEAQGGTVGVRSTLRKGSTFHAVFPRQALKDDAAPDRRSFAGPYEGAPVVLVIEDNDRDRETVVRTLMAAGYAVETAATGAQALTLCRERTFRAITLDLLLPDMSGLDVLHAIRSEGVNRETQVIVITIVTEKGGIAGYALHDLLGKPVDSAALLASLVSAGVLKGTGAVLVVDDDVRNLRLMAATLTQLGYSAKCVPTGEEGLRFARETPPVAVVLDLMMPEMDGFAFLDRFRELPHCSRVPVIVWSLKNLTYAEHDRLRQTAQGIVNKRQERHLTEIDDLRALLALRN